MLFYADASFLVSLYTIDGNSAAAKAAVSGITTPFPLNDLHALEARNALELAVFRGQLTSTQAVRAWANLQEDLSAGRLTRSSPNWPVAFRYARWLARRRTSKVGTRSSDILHIACAQLETAREFYSFDSRQRKLAAALGLAVRP